jgi:hypothetical protein
MSRLGWLSRDIDGELGGANGSIYEGNIDSGGTLLSLLESLLKLLSHSPAILLMISRPLIKKNAPVSFATPRTMSVLLDQIDRIAICEDAYG